jgi:hypothetical protein
VRGHAAFGHRDELVDVETGRLFWSERFQVSATVIEASTASAGRGIATVSVLPGTVVDLHDNPWCEIGSEQTRSDAPETRAHIPTIAIESLAIAVLCDEPFEPVRC